MRDSLRRRPRKGRRALALAAATALTLGLAATPATADDHEESSGAKGTYTHNHETGHRISTDAGTVGTTIFVLTLDDGTELLTYCIDFRTGIKQDARYIEDDWENYPGQGDFAEPGKVHWILQNSYPAVAPEDLSEASGVEGLTAEDALTGTQAAIWHYSNDINLEDKSEYAAAYDLYEYLVDNAEDLPQTEEPEASLAFDPSEAEGVAGEIVGEFAVSTNADSVPLELEGPEGVEVVDLDGNPVESVSDGDTFGVQVPEDAEPGEATVSASVSADVMLGRLFKGKKNKKTQTLITARGESTTVEQSVHVSWAEGDDTPPPDDEETPPPDDEETPPPDDEETPPPGDEEKPPGDDGGDDGGLPVTGPTLAALVAVAVAAVGGGGLAIYLSRKRRTNSVPLEG